MKKNWHKRLGAVVCLLAVAWGLTSCGSEEQTEQSAVIPFPQETPQIQPSTGGEVLMPMPVNADMTDPLRVNTEEMLSFYSLIYESLIRINESGRLTAELAENWSTEDGGKVWTVNLRSGIYWSDGTQLTANDVSLTFARLKELGEESYYSYCVDKIAAIETIDATTLKVTMINGGYCSLYALTFPVLKNGNPSTTPMGTGPYFVSSATSEQVILSANENWWKQRAYIDTFVFLERDSNETALASYSAGQLTMVPTSSTSAGRYREDGVTTVLDVMTQTVELMLINSKTAALQDINVRKALAYGLDRSKITSKSFSSYHFYSSATKYHLSTFPIKSGSRAPDTF